MNGVCYCFVEKWQKSGGVLLMGYEMYRLLSSKKVHLQKPKSRKKTPGSDVIDVEEVDRDKNLLVGQLLSFFIT